MNKIVCSLVVFGRGSIISLSKMPFLWGEPWSVYEVFERLTSKFLQLKVCCKGLNFKMQVFSVLHTLLTLTDLQPIVNMGGRKLRFHHRKQHRKQSLVVSLPVSSTPSLESLYSCLVAETLPELWTVVSKHPLVIVKLRVHQTSTVPRVDVVITLAVNDSLNWTLSALNISLNPALNSSLKNIASTIFAVSDILDLVKVLDSLKFCVGNPDAKFLEWFKHRSTTLHGLSGAYLTVLYDVVNSYILNSRLPEQFLGCCVNSNYSQTQ